MSPAIAPLFLQPSIAGVLTHSRPVATPSVPGHRKHTAPTRVARSSRLPTTVSQDRCAFSRSPMTKFHVVGCPTTHSHSHIIQDPRPRSKSAATPTGPVVEPSRPFVVSPGIDPPPRYFKSTTATVPLPMARPFPLSLLGPTSSSPCRFILPFPT